MTITRDVDPEVAFLRGKVAGYTRVGDMETAARYRIELEHEKILAAARRVVADLPKLPREKRDRAVLILLEGLAAAHALAARLADIPTDNRRPS